MLFSPFTVKNLELKNRIVMPPMCMYSAQDGMVNDWHIVHYATRAAGQAGLVIVEATGVEERGRISDRDLGIWDDQHIEGLGKIVKAVHDYGAKAAIQLNHAGRKSEVTALEPVGPSAIPFSDTHRIPHSLSKEEIATIVTLFKNGAKRAFAAGFDAIEIHAAHGYLINQFLSPLANTRTDEYGGSLENRARLLDEVLAAVREVLPADYPVLVRVSAEEYDPEGNRPETVAAIINLVKARGIDVVHVSSGAVISAPVRAYPGYQIGLAAIIKQHTGLPVIGGGLITEPHQAEQVIKAGIDCVFLGRQLLREPYWPLRAAHELQADIEWPEQYLRGKFGV